MLAIFRLAICSETVQDSVSALGVLGEEGNSFTSNTVVSGPETVPPSSVLHRGKLLSRTFQSVRSPRCNVINTVH